MGKRYDFIVVGAGSAGCVLADRLTARGGHRVLLLEAGGSDDDVRIRSPSLYQLLWRTKFDWDFYTTPQADVNGRTMFWPRGKVLGGTSSLNAMVYVRGHRSNYDEWRDLGYDEVLPYFKRSEDFRGPPSDYHGQGGPMTVTPCAASTPVTGAFIESAARVCGVPISTDFNGASQEGIGAFHHTIVDGKRCSTADAFLRPALQRPGLEVSANTVVLGIVLERGRAIGVRVRRAGVEEVLHADGEVILAAGAVGSPQLLLSSGIGPADHLRGVGISVNHDLPGVGENLQDHVLTVNDYVTLERGSLHINVASFAAWIAYFAMTGRGPLRNTPIEAGGFLRTHASQTRPELQLHFAPWPTDHPNSDVKRPIPFGRRFTIFPSLIYPKSRGTVRLRSSDPLAAPAIDPRYFSEPQDLQVLVEGVKLSREIAASSPLSRFRGEEVSPGAASIGDDDLRAKIRERANTIYHPVGTCKMGVDELAVVDPGLRVRGIAGLRVVDASIMPTIPGGNTNAPVIMIAERAADLILGTG
jgi:choline dehydrogenase